MNETFALRARLTELFATTLNIEVPGDDVDLFESGVLDSLAFVELLFSLERTFGIETSVGDLEPANFRTLACIAEFVAGRMAAAGDGPDWVASLKVRAG